MASTLPAIMLSSVGSNFVPSESLTEGIAIRGGNRLAIADIVFNDHPRNGILGGPLPNAATPAWTRRERQVLLCVLHFRHDFVPLSHQLALQ
jgi:hypothetical protein